MRLFKWTKLHESFLPEIDAEHRHVFRLGDEIQQAVAAGAPNERLQALVETLTASIEEHFAHEERLMRASRYTSYNWHKQQHDAVRRRIAQFTAALNEGNGEPTLLLEYLSGWLKDHAALADRMMGAHLRNHGRGHAMAS